MNMKSKKVEFQPPKDFAIPEGLSAGERFDSVCTFELKDTGTVCMTMMGDADMPGYGKEEKAEHESKPDYGNVAGDLMNNKPTGGY